MDKEQDLAKALQLGIINWSQYFELLTKGQLSVSKPTVCDDKENDKSEERE